jgi:hypothetical protein
MTLLVPLLAILAGAQPARAPTVRVQPAAEPAPEPVRPRAERAPTGGEQFEQASKDLVRLRRALTEVLRRVEDARHEKDLLKLLCLDERVSQIKVLLTVGERAEMALTEAIVNRDDGAAVEVSKISIARAKVDALRAEAAACIGQLAYEVGQRTEVLVEEPEDLPDVDELGPVVRSPPGQDPYRTEFGIPSAAR